MTVSKVLRDAPDISTATKARVRLLADQMGYMPDTVAQGLRNRTTKLFGLVISAATNPIFARVVMGIEEKAYGLGYDVITAHTLNIPEREESVIRRLLSRRVDGLFLSPVYRLDPTVPIYKELAKRGVPTVLLGQRAPFCQRFTNVETDDQAASYAVTQHLLSLGHKRIALFVSSDSQVTFTFTTTGDVPEMATVSTPVSVAPSAPCTSTAPEDTRVSEPASATAREP